MENRWFDQEELNEYLELSKKGYLTEVVSAETRVKLARAARRTAKRRAVSSKLHRKKPAKSSTLKKRTYEQIKNNLRKRVGGKNWKSLAYSTRERIDKTLKKRTPAIKKMAKKLITSAKKKENQRIQKIKSDKK
jgi:hypothetical protein